MTDKPVISDAEVDALLKDVCIDTLWVADRVRLKRALSAFLLARVPDAVGKPNVHNAHAEDDWFEDGFNACREQVLRGKE